MITIAVTAASGQLGRAIVKALTARHEADTVIAIARTPGKARDLGVEVRAGDYADRAGLERALAGVDVVLLVSGMDAPAERIGQHRNVIGAAKAAGVGKIVYTSVQGPEKDGSFAPIVESNRQTEQDIRACGLDWAIGRNGIYIEPDIACIGAYKAAGEIANSAGTGRCGYTTRDELAFAYARMLTDDSCNGRTLNLHGEPLTQTELAGYMNDAFGTSLAYRAMDVAQYRQDRVAALGDFIGTVVAGIYSGIRDGAFDNRSDYAEAAGRPHLSWGDYFSTLGPRSAC